MQANRHYAQNITLIIMQIAEIRIFQKKIQKFAGKAGKTAN
jgi:hypothetical protein